VVAAHALDLDRSLCHGRILDRGRGYVNTLGKLRLQV
jgi:hypothetical protein